MSAPKKYPATYPFGQSTAATSSFTRFVSNTITTWLLSISDSRPNAVVSISYNCVSNTARSASRSVWVRPGLGAAVSTYSAMCWPVFMSAASTVGKVLQLKSPHTLNELIIPESAAVNARRGGGTAWATACTVGCAPVGRGAWGGAGYTRLRSACRKNRWNCSAGETAAGPASGGATSEAIADGASTLATSLKLWVSFGVPVAACATSRYSVADALAGKTMQPDTGPGSMD